MNDPAPPKKASRSSFVLGFLIGAGVSFIVSTLIVALGTYAWVQKKAADARKGWDLVPVVVAAQDIPENTQVTFEMMMQRSVPAQFVTSSVVKPDSAGYILNQRLLVPVQAGDPLLWSQFATRNEPVPAGASAAEGKK